MKEWLRRIRGVIGIGAVWAAVWAAVGALMGIVDRGASMDELWLGPAIGMQPGFLGGVLFRALGITAGLRRLSESSSSKVVACGAIAGLLVGVLPFVINEPTNEAPLWLVGVVVVGSMSLLGAVSAIGSLSLARRASTASR